MIRVKLMLLTQQNVITYKSKSSRWTFSIKEIGKLKMLQTSHVMGYDLFFWNKYWFASRSQFDPLHWIKLMKFLGGRSRILYEPNTNHRNTDTSEVFWNYLPNLLNLFNKLSLHHVPQTELKMFYIKSHSILKWNRFLKFKINILKRFLILTGI